MQNDKEKFKKDFIERLIQFSVRIINLTEELKKEKAPLSIIDQLIRSSTSVGANIVEAKASSSKKEYTNFFQIALKSANETKYWLILTKESFPQIAERVDWFLKEIDEISKIIGSSILTLKSKK
ncbi:MAG: four helix bundle protein [bacterium]|nr:four helix bundle protein [bacterium]